MEPTQKQSPAIPIAIVIGFGFISAAIFFGGSGTVPASQSEPDEVVAETSQVRPVDETDHIRGNPNAPILLVEYSDYDCPFCKNFHETMKRVVSEYGPGGQVAWVYRQFPIQQLHPNAPFLATASECVAELGGNDAFWTFSDLVFGERAANELTQMSRLPEFASTAGVNEVAFNECMDSGRMQEKVTSSLQDGVNAGASGTPYTIVLVGDQQVVINGAQSFERVRQTIDNLITVMDGGTIEIPVTE